MLSTPSAISRGKKQNPGRNRGFAEEMGLTRVGRSLRKLRRRRIQIEGAYEKIHETPDGNHHEEADKAVDHEGLASLALLFVGCARDEVLEHAPKEDDKCEREDERNEDVV